MFSMVQLECFLAVAEELHFGQAAERLQMTQPPLSRHIQQIERTLGTPLFLRSSRRVELTAAGRALLPRARQLIDLAAKSEAEVRSVTAGTAGTLTIGYTAMAGLTILPDLIRRKREDFPGVRLFLRELVSTDQVDELAHGTIDLALMRPIGPRKGMVSRRVFEEELVLAVPSDWALASEASPVPLSALEGTPFLMYSPGESRYLHDLLQTILREQQVRPRIMQYAGQIMAILALVGAGLGCAIVPASARDIISARIVLLPIHLAGKTAEPPLVGIELAWNPETITPLVRSIVAIAIGESEPPFGEGPQR